MRPTARVSGQLERTRLENGILLKFRISSQNAPTPSCPLHALLDGTLTGTSSQIQPKARERTHRRPDSLTLRLCRYYDTNAGKQLQPFGYRTNAEPKKIEPPDFLPHCGNRWLIDKAGKADNNHNPSLVLIMPKTIRTENARSV